MKKLFTFFLMAMVAGSCLAMSRSKIKKNARFLTDRMAYELDLTPYQYDDCYEINYDFLYAVDRVLGDAVYGYSDAITMYYRCLDLRNDDLCYILSARQYNRFMASEYFYRPVYSTGSNWALRIYTIYSNRSFFYFDAPTVYRSYKGQHSRIQHSNGFYVNRYQNLSRYQGDTRMVGSVSYDTHRRSDFGTVIRQKDQPTYNTYSNPNQNHRTTDSRYRDNSGNTQSPYINNRTQQGTRQGSTQTQRPQQGQTQRTQPQQGQPQQTGTVTSGRRGNTTQTQPQSTQQGQQTQPQRTQQTQQNQPQQNQNTGGNTRQGNNTGTRGGRR